MRWEKGRIKPKEWEMKGDGGGAQEAEAAGTDRKQETESNFPR